MPFEPISNLDPTPDGILPHEHTAKPDSIYSISLPPDISLGELRRNLQATSQLIVSFQLTDTENAGPRKINFKVPGRDVDVVLYTDMKYIVGYNEDSLGDVFLNPLIKADGKSDEANIPSRLDQFLATVDARVRCGGLVITTESPDANLQEAVSQIIEIRKNDIYRQDYIKGILSLGEGRIKAILEENLIASGLMDLERGSGFLEKVMQLINTDGELYFCGLRLDGKDKSVEEVVNEISSSVFEVIKQTIETKLPQLKSMVRDRNEMAMLLVKFWPGKGIQNEGYPIVLAYFPKLGWTCSFSRASCPGQAIGMFDSLLSGTLEEQFFPTFSESSRNLIDKGDLILEPREGVILYRGVDKLHFQEAVYHGDDPVEQALATLYTASHPILGEHYFQMILFKDLAESQPDITPSLTLTEQDIGKPDNKNEV